MSAEIKPGYTTKRQHLADVLPLEAPFTLCISPTQACNFKCFYCTHSKSKDELRKMNFHSINMDFRLFQKILNDSKRFDGKIKRVIFTGLGEPLINSKLPNMIQLMRDNGISKRFEVITNGSLLTKEMSDRLIEAGLTFMKISIQGLTSDKYREIAGVDIDFNRLIDNIRYFYRNKKQCRLHIKIMDVDFADYECEKDFYNIFEDICDEMYVEHIAKSQPSMNYGEQINSQKTYYGDEAHIREVCPFAYYYMQIDSDGNTFPCCPQGLPDDFSFGNAYDMSVYDIWNSKKLNDFRIGMLEKGRSINKHCDTCVSYLCMTPDEDNLDNDRDLLLKKYEDRYGCQK